MCIAYNFKILCPSVTIHLLRSEELKNPGNKYEIMASSDLSSETAAAVPKTELSLDLDEEELDDLDGMHQAS